MGKIIKINKRWGGEGMDWIDLAAGSCECGNEPSGSLKCDEYHA
jgi:hypothetical protein